MTARTDDMTENTYGGPPGAHGLYRPDQEHDGCGVGFVAHVKGQRSHEIIRDADHLLCRMDHRAAREIGLVRIRGDFAPADEYLTFRGANLGDGGLADLACGLVRRQKNAAR